MLVYLGQQSLFWRCREYVIYEMTVNLAMIFGHSLVNLYHFTFYGFFPSTYPAKYSTQMEKGQIGTYSFYFSSKWSENKYGQKNSMCRSFMIRIHLTFFVVVISKIFFFRLTFFFFQVFFVPKPFLKTFDGKTIFHH